MGIRWVTKREAAFVNELTSGDYRVESLALNEDKQVVGGFYYLINAAPAGGWKGNMWAIVWTDLARRSHQWYRTSDEARQAWRELEAISEAQAAASG